MLIRISTTTMLIAAAMTVGGGAARAFAAGQDAAKGAQVYAAQKCQVCHSIAGKGGKASPLDGIGGKLSADEIRHWIVDPVDAAAKAKSTKKPPMQNKYSKLPAADIDGLVAYIQTLK